MRSDSGTTNLLLTLNLHLEQDRSPSPKGEGGDEVVPDAQGNLLLEVVTVGSMMDRKRFNQLQIGKYIRMKLQTHPASH